MRLQKNYQRNLSHFLNTLRLFGVGVLVNCFLTTPLTNIVSDVHEADSLSIQFGIFSPAYAAFEDAYLFEGEHNIKSISLVAGTSSRVFQENAVDKKILTPQNIHPMSFVIHNQASSADPFYDDEISQGEVDRTPEASFVSPAQPLKIAKKKSTKRTISATDAQPQSPQFILSLGPIVASAVNPAAEAAPWHPGGGGKPSIVQQATNPLDSGVGERSLGHTSAHKKHAIGGELQLVGGLAFLGALEVSWIVDGEEVERGQISLNEGRYDIKVQGLTGHIVISLYDENEYLIGEGSANLEEMSQQDGFDPQNVPIRVTDINVTLAGKVKSVYSIGANDDPINDAEVSLFGIDATTTTNADGEYHFNEWKNSDSKTLAQASKPGYKDSVFLVDSKISQDVILLSDSYATAFFSRLEEIGFDSDISEKGLIYGTIKRPKGSSEGLRAEVDGYQSIYLQSYFAMEGQNSTDNSGLFAVVGLDEGDHVLRIFDGKALVDRRVLAVENGKVSPIQIDLRLQTKVLRFIDPLFNDPIPTMGTRYFDGEYFLNEDTERTKSKLSQGSDPALLEFAFDNGQENNVFVSRNDQFQEIPVINQKWFKALHEKMNLDPTLGIAFGFIETRNPFRVVVAEKDPKQTLYFDKNGELLEAPGRNMAGFILIGIDEGLHTIMLESPEGDELYLTDLVYNNHESHSVIFHEL